MTHSYKDRKEMDNYCKMESSFGMLGKSQGLLPTPSVISSSSSQATALCFGFQCIFRKETISLITKSRLLSPS